MMGVQCSTFKVAPLALILSLSFVTSAVHAEEGEDDDSHPALVARYVAGGKTIERIDRDVQFVWGTHSPDQRLPPGSFSARWTGKLLIRTEGKHAFHLYLGGEAKVTLGGTTVVSGRRDEPGWVHGELMAVEFGEQDLEISYQKIGARGEVRLFWSSEGFPIEPVPPQLFFHDEARPELELLERGRNLYAAHRCGACHRRERESMEPAPALSGAASSLYRVWLTGWLIEPGKQSPHARMPGFGFSRDDVRAVVAVLSQQTAPGDPKKFVEELESKATVRSGKVLFRSIGCLACHTRGEEGDTSIFGGGDLTDIGKKRTPGWIDQWLQEPQKLNPDHRMPVFALANDERRSLALFLAGPQRGDEASREPENSPDAALVASGKKLIETARCAACHRLDGFKADTSAIPTLERPIGDWSKSCSDAAADPNHVRPAFALATEDCRALRAYMESRYGPVAPESPFVRGQSLLRQKGCLNCHERDGGRGIATVAGAIARLDPDLAGQSEALVPPDLTAVGDKLRDEALALAIAGKQKAQRLPWLRVRMPRFNHQPAEAEALLTYLVSHDRIPDVAPQWPESSALPDTQAADHEADLRKAGALLAGTRGFSCSACHKIASHEPRGVALATRGSDLYLIGKRMRPEFFARWTRSPLRIIPGMEMPSFERPIAGVLDGKIEQQLAALWEALNDKSGPPKIDTSTIEQVLTVAPGERPKIIRDVFALGDPLALKFAPRAFAVGFGNGVNVLFDLDTMALRDWWRSDFARQRSSGKSWFWEPAGRGIIAASWDTPDIALRKAGDPKSPPVIAQREGGRFGRLLSYGRIVPPDENGAVVSKEPQVRDRPSSHLDLGIKLDYSLRFLVGNEAVALDIAESFLPTGLVHDNDDSWWREVTVRNVPTGYDVVLRDAARGLVEAAGVEDGPVPWKKMKIDREKQTATCRLDYPDNYAKPKRELQAPVSLPPAIVERVTSVPGYDGIRLPLTMSIMPTAITWTADGTLAFCSLKGEVFLAKDTDADGVEDKLTTFEEGLAAPYGLIADGKDLIVAHKPELLRLRDTDGDGRADVREIIADGWGYTEDYHDWTTGIVRDSKGNLYVGTGSDYAKPGRDREKSKWRGKVLRIDPTGDVTPLGHAFRYPTGLAITPDDQVFVSDNQGVQNTFNEFNHLVDGASYGVPSQYEELPDSPATPPAIQVPHPWTRSVNGIFFLLPGGMPPEFAGHGIGCEYDLRFLVRFTLERVGKTYQGAVYPFSVPTPASSRDGFIGTLCGAVSPKGDIYIGSIYDSGWVGGTNVGDIVRLRPNGKLPVGIREIRAAEGRFLVSFTGAIDKAAAGRTENYNISGYTRKWQGTYATPDSGRHQLEVLAVDVAADGLSVVLQTSRQQEGHVYEIIVGKIGPAGQTTIWPSTGSYTLNQMPAASR